MPFIFVRHGDPPPLEWMARHPGGVKFPAVMIPRSSPHHPANGGPYPTFAAPPPPVPKAAPVSEAEQWPLGRPACAGLRGAMSRLRPGGRPPPYPGGHGAPAGRFPWIEDDPVAACRRASAVLDRGRAGPAGSSPSGEPARDRHAGLVTDVSSATVAPASLRAGTNSANPLTANPMTSGTPTAQTALDHHQVELAQLAPELPLPLPPVVIPGTQQNDDFVRSILRAGREVGSALGSILRSDAADPPVPKKESVDKLVESSRPRPRTGGYSRSYDRPGGYSDAEGDFKSLNPADVRPDPKRPGVVIGTLPDGRTINVRPQSSHGRPTLEIFDPVTKKAIKIRYGDKP